MDFKRKRAPGNQTPDLEDILTHGGVIGDVAIIPDAGYFTPLSTEEYPPRSDEELNQLPLHALKAVASSRHL